MRANAPMWWYNKSCHLRAAATVLRVATEVCDYSDLAKTLGSADAINDIAYAEPVYEMLCGMSLELIYKAVLVAKHESYPDSHDLNDLAARAGINCTENIRNSLNLFTHAVIWNGRYPVPREKDEIKYYKQQELRAKIGGSGNLSKVAERIECAMGLKAFNKLWTDAAELFFEAKERNTS